MSDIEPEGGGAAEVPTNMPPIYIRVALEIDPPEMEKNPLSSPFDGDLNRAVVPDAVQKVGMTYAGESAFRTERNDYLSLKAGRPGKSALDT
jgi:hypothetical protein